MQGEMSVGHWEDKLSSKIFSVPLYPVRKSGHGLLPYTEPETLNGPLSKHYNIVLL